MPIMRSPTASTLGTHASSRHLHTGHMWIATYFHALPRNWTPTQHVVYGHTLVIWPSTLLRTDSHVSSTWMSTQCSTWSHVLLLRGPPQTCGGTPRFRRLDAAGLPHHLRWASTILIGCPRSLWVPTMFRGKPRDKLGAHIFAWRSKAMLNWVSTCCIVGGQVFWLGVHTMRLGIHEVLWAPRYLRGLSRVWLGHPFVAYGHPRLTVGHP